LTVLFDCPADCDQISHVSRTYPLLERIAHYPDAAALQAADQGELLAVYCEAMVAAQEAAGFRSVPGAAEERKS